MKCPQCGAVIPTIDDTFIQTVATAREFEAWRMRKRGMRVKYIAEDMGVTSQAVSNFRRRLLKRIEKMRPELL